MMLGKICMSADEMNGISYFKFSIGDFHSSDINMCEEMLYNTDFFFNHTLFTTP